MIEAVSVEAIGGGAKFRRRSGKITRAQAALARARARTSSPAAHGTTPPSTRAISSRPATRSTARRSSSSRTRPSWSSPAGRPRSPRRTISCSTRVVTLKRTTRDRHQGRSGDARSVQQPVHVDRRADGRGAAEHRLFGEHQGAARLLLRGVRADGTLVANAPHMPVHLGSMDRAVETIIRENKGRIRRATSTRSTRPTTAARTCPTSRSARRCSTTRRRTSCSGSRRAATTPTSAASRPARCRRTRPLSRRKASVRQLQARRSRPLPREGALRRAHRREISRAQSAAERQRHEGADRRQREGRAGAAQDGGAVHAAGGEGLHAARAGQRRRERAARDRPPARFIVRLCDGPGHRDQGEDHGRQGEARGDRRLHRHLAAAADQLQRARAGDARRRALRVPRDGRRRHPDECRLPAADQHHHPEEARC